MVLTMLPMTAMAENGIKGTAANPYTLAELGAMTREQYIAAQNTLSGIMYVNVGDYNYDTNGVLGNGTADNSDRDSTKLNYYGAPGAKSGQYSDAAVGKNIVFVGRSITSGVKGYTSIDNIGTSLLLAVPAYTNVTFQNITFNNVMSFDYQLYTSPWSQLGELKFEGCTFNGIIVGAIAAQTLTFNGCKFENYTNRTNANSSNPTWIRPAYGNWKKGDNEGQGEGFKSLTTINFTGNTVTSTRPVKFERISQWDITSTVTATGNSFDISAQEGDATEGKTKNVGLYLGAFDSTTEFNLVAESNTKIGTTAALYTVTHNPDAKGVGLPAGSTVKDSNGNEITLTDALEWKTTNQLTLETAYDSSAVAGINGVGYSSIANAINAAKAGDTVKLLQNVEEDVTIPAEKTITLALNGKKLTNVSGDTITNNGNLTIVGEGTVDNVTHGKADIYNNGTATLNGGSYTRSKEASTSTTDPNGNSYYNILNHGVMTINSGVSVTSSGHFSSLIDNGYYSFADNENPRSGYVASTNMETPSLTISGGSFSGGINTIKNDDNGKLTILDGTFTNYTQAALQNHHIATVRGGTFEGTGVAKAVINCGNPKCTVAEHDQHNLTIFNGKFKGEVTKNPDSTLIIYAGYFTSEPDAAYLAPGKAVYFSNLAGYDYMVAAVEPATPVTPSEPAVNPFNENAGKNSVKFGDVADNAWYASAVNYAVDKGLMNGTGKGKFSPEADTTRGMIVTILARLDGKNTSGTPWYQAGQRWAMEYEISDGTNMTGAITREQLVTMLFRYAVKNGLEAVTLSENLTQFTDASDISAWAVSAMQWAVGQGLIQGSNGQLRPQANASRAEVATILMRFCEVLCK